MVNITCPVCGSSNTNMTEDHKDHSIYTCNHCHLIFPLYEQMDDDQIIQAIWGPKIM